MESSCNTQLNLTLCNIGDLNSSCKRNAQIVGNGKESSKSAPEKPTNLYVPRYFLTHICRPCLIITKSCYVYVYRITKHFERSRFMVCVSRSVHVISTSCVRKGSWAFFNLKEAFSVLMLRALINRRRPFSYHTKMADFRVFSCFVRFLVKTNWQKLRKVS